MVSPSTNSRQTAAIVLAVACLAAGCGDSGAPSVGTAIPVGVEIAPGVGASVAGGALRSDRVGRPLVWTSGPEVTLAVATDPSGSGETSLRIANLPPHPTVTVSEVTYRSSSDLAECDRADPRTVDCQEGDDPLCDAPSLATSEGPATRATLTPELPGCVRVRYEITGEYEPDGAVEMALVGATERSDSLDAIVERAASRNADLAVLLGDHLASSTSEDLRSMAGELEALPIPIVVVPGERERLSGSLAQFRQTFGPTDLGWQIGTIQFLTVESATGSLGENGVAELQDRIDGLDAERPVVVITHTPPLDPNGLRDRGFQSRIEGTRVLSVLSEEEADLLVAGHVPGATRKAYDGFELVLPPDGDEGAFSVVELGAREEAKGELEMEMRTRGR